MIVTTVNDCARYAHLHPAFPALFEYNKTQINTKHELCNI